MCKAWSESDVLPHSKSIMQWGVLGRDKVLKRIRHFAIGCCHNTSVKIMQLNEWRCRDAPCEK